MEVEYNGYIGNYGRIWSSRGDDDSVRIFYLATEPIHTGDSYDRIGSGLQAVGRYYY